MNQIITTDELKDYLESLVESVNGEEEPAEKDDSSSSNGDE